MSFAAVIRVTAPGDVERAALTALVTEAQQGDRESFGRIFDTFHLQVYRYALARIGNTADAEDVAADAFSAAFQNIGRFRWRGRPFEAWLFSIARSKVVDHHRRSGHRSSTGDISIVSEDQLPQKEDVVQEVIRRDEQARAIAALPLLSQDQQEVVALRFFAGLSLKETAGVMRRTPSAVKQLQFRAVIALREHLEVAS